MLPQSKFRGGIALASSSHAFCSRRRRGRRSKRWLHCQLCFRCLSFGERRQDKLSNLQGKKRRDCISNRFCENAAGSILSEVEPIGKGLEARCLVGGQGSTTL